MSTATTKVSMKKYSFLSYQHTLKSELWPFTCAVGFAAGLISLRHIRGFRLRISGIFPHTFTLCSCHLQEYTSNVHEYHLTYQTIYRFNRLIFRLNPTLNLLPISWYSVHKYVHNRYISLNINKFSTLRGVHLVHIARLRACDNAFVTKASMLVVLSFTR